MLRSSKSTSLLAKKPASGYASAAPTSSSSHPGSVSVSLFRSATSSASEDRIPAFTAALKPRFSGRGSTRTSGKSRLAIASEPSVEPLSTRTVSKSSNDWGRRDPRHVQRNLSPFQLGTTTVTRGDTISGGSALLYFLRGVDLDLRGQVHHAPVGVPVRRAGDPVPRRRLYPVQVEVLARHAGVG